MIRKNIPSAEIRSWPAPGAPSATRPAARRTPWIAGLLALLAASGYSPRFGNPTRVATGYISHVVCSYVFISGLDTARVVEEDIAGNPVFSKIDEVLYMAGASSLRLAENKGKQASKVTSDKLREDARDYLSQLVNGYPDSSFRKQAEEDLKGLGGPKPKDNKP